MRKWNYIGRVKSFNELTFPIHSGDLFIAESDIILNNGTIPKGASFVFVGEHIWVITTEAMLTKQSDFKIKWRSQ